MITLIKIVLPGQLLLPSVMQAHSEIIYNSKFAKLKYSLIQKIYEQKCDLVRKSSHCVSCQNPSLYQMKSNQNVLMNLSCIRLKGVGGDSLLSCHHSSI